MPADAEITNLPDDVFRNIREFVPIDALFLVANRHLHAMKRRLHYYRFTKECSLEYHASKTFREHVKRRISDISLQLSLCLINYNHIRDMSALGGVDSLDLPECSNITDVSALGGVHTLNLSGCRNITDVSALGGVHTLNLSGCWNIRDVSAL